MPGYFKSEPPEHTFYSSSIAREPRRDRVLWTPGIPKRAKRGGHAEVPRGIAVPELREQEVPMRGEHFNYSACSSTVRGMNFPFIAATSGGAREVSEIRKQIRKPGRLARHRGKLNDPVWCGRCPCLRRRSGIWKSKPEIGMISGEEELARELNAKSRRAVEMKIPQVHFGPRSPADSNGDLPRKLFSIQPLMGTYRSPSR